MIAHDIAGAADSSPYDAVLLIHAGVANRRMWQPQWDVLAARHRVIRVDLRGFGESPLPPGPFSFVDDVREVLAAAGAERIAVVASSFGGRISLELAATTAELVDTLVLMCSAFGGAEPTDDVESFAAQEEELLEAGDVAGATELNVRTWLGPDADDATREQVRTMQRRAFDVQIAADEQPDPPEPQWIEIDPRAITARTLLISGAHDLQMFGRIAVDLADRIPDATHTELDWAGHLPSLERPDELSRLLLDTLG